MRRELELLTPLKTDEKQKQEPWVMWRLLHFFPLKIWGPTEMEGPFLRKMMIWRTISEELSITECTNVTTMTWSV